MKHNPRKLLDESVRMELIIIVNKVSYGRINGLRIATIIVQNTYSKVQHIKVTKQELSSFSSMHNLSYSDFDLIIARKIICKQKIVTFTMAFNKKNKEIINI